MKKTIEKAKDYVKELLSDESTGHDYCHALRVYNMALYLAIGKDVDLDVISLAAILHDVDDKKIAPKNSHRALDFLKEHVSDEIKEQVTNIIDNMSYSSQIKGSELHTLEGKIVQDADRLDALGAIGIARCFAYTGKINRKIYDYSIDDDSGIAHFYQKLFNLDALMNTSEARIIAEQRIEFMKEYLKEFFKEWR
ncbi:MAG: HD domain-containing protein [Candidatus Izemoplasmatales bacterium]|nr:HD domain-containing protein [Candidatus Izemoplasmatales bacterium]